jgi:hypothetical protein
VQPGEHREGDAFIMRAKQREKRQQVDLLGVIHAGFDQMLDALINQNRENDDEKRRQNRVTLHHYPLASRVSASRRIS